MKNRHTLRCSITVLFACAAVTSPACGPFFPEDMLDKPQGILQPPAFHFMSEFYKLPQPAIAGLDPSRKPGSPAYTLDLEMKEMALIMNRSIADESARNAWLDDYRAMRAVMIATGDVSRYAMRENETKTDGSRVTVRIENRNWPEGLPGDVRRYLDGAASYAASKKTSGEDSAKALAAAREIWKELLALPPGERHWRSTWAAWMLFRTTDVHDCEEQALWLDKTRALSAEGFADALNLGIEATYIRGRVGELLAEDRRLDEVEYFRASCLRAVLGHSNADYPDTYPVKAEPGRIMKDAYLRKVVLLQSIDHGSVWRGDGSYSSSSEGAEKKAWLSDEWLRAFEEAKIQDQPEATLLGWSAYNAAQFDQARRWLKLAPKNDSMALWLRSKLAAMGGDRDQAARLMALAAPKYPLQGSQNDRARREMELDALLTVGDRLSGISEVVQHHYAYADLGTTRLAVNDFVGALRAFSKTDYNREISYIAERLISADELIAFTRERYPAPKKSAVKSREDEETDKAVEKVSKPLTLASLQEARDEQSDGMEGDETVRFRYMVGRRLARENRFKDALPYFPERLRKVLSYYMEQYRKGHDTALTKAARAAALWNTAQLHRALGMELFGYEDAPDNSAWEGSYEFTGFSEIRSKKYWLPGWMEADMSTEPEADQLRKKKAATPVLPATVDEKWRAKHYAPAVNKRFHYRYVAADLAWQAAKLMPDNDAHTAEVLCIAGSWLKHRDADAADRFYQALVSRNPDIPLAQQADKSRWFPDVAWNFNPAFE